MTDEFYNGEWKEEPGIHAKRHKRSGAVLRTILALILAMVLGASMATAGLGVFLAVNEVDILSLLDGTYKERYVFDARQYYENLPLNQIVIEDHTVSPVALIARKAIPSIVGIEVTYPVSTFLRTTQMAKGEGSGIILTEDGYIVTNNHVVENALAANQNGLLNNASIKVFLYGNLDKPHDAVVVGRDAESDIAVLKIETEETLIAAEIGDSDLLVVGELAVAVGNPGGMSFMGSVTAGIISGLNREMKDSSSYESAYGNREVLRLIQTDAAINPGNSGGALLDSEGKVIGINSMKISGAQYEGLGFAIPINRAMEIVAELKETGKFTRGNPVIGIYINDEYTPEVARANNLPEGVMISGIIPMSPAFMTGLRQYDILVEFNGEKITSFTELEREKYKYNPGETVSLKIFRLDSTFKDGEYLELELVLGES
ncbi:MAG: trypsin-like peptidase domain-containing protein [Clostridia bacterium]